MIFHSSFEYTYLWLPFIGFIIGLAASMIGSGGGFFFLPVLILIFKLPAQIAVATSLAATLPICIVGSFSHYRNDNINFRMGLLFIITGFLGAITGAWITSLVTTPQLKTGFGIYSLLIAVPLLVNYRRYKKSKIPKLPVPKGLSIKKISRGSFYGLLSGVITGSFGTSGAAPVLAGLLSLQMPVRLVAGTSLLIILINTISALGAHFLVGEIDMTIVYFLASGSVIGAFAGPVLLSGINTTRAEGSVRMWYAVALIIVGIIILLS
jgi:uncharacterized membrane protein YfcA